MNLAVSACLDSPYYFISVTHKTKCK